MDKHGIYRWGLFYLTGWFSAVIGFEIKPIYGTVAGFVSFIALAFFFIWLDDRRSR